MKIICKTGFAALLLTLGLAGTHAALADKLNVFNTGVNAQGTALAAGVADSHYTLITAPSGVATGSGSALATVNNPNWVSDTSSYSWISPTANGNDNQPTGTYDYRTTFTISASQLASTAQLSGFWTSDNQSCISLNGIATGICNGNTSYSALQSFSLTSGFVTGINTLDFIVLNTTSPTGIVSPGGPSGLVAQVSGTVSTAVTPEPSTFVMLGTGMAGVITQIRRRVQA